MSPVQWAGINIWTLALKQLASPVPKLELESCVLPGMPGGDGHTKARIAPLTYPDADLTQAAGYHLAQRGRAKHRDRRSHGGRAQVPPEPN